MEVSRYKVIKETFNLTSAELQVFLLNYYNAFTYNEYLQTNSEYQLLSHDIIEKLNDYFEENEIDEETRKKIVISMPMIFSCEDYDKQLDFVYKDSKFEGIIIKDEDNKLHAYRVKKHARSITENMSLITDLITASEEDLKKTYYIKAKAGKLSKREK